MRLRCGAVAASGTGSLRSAGWRSSRPISAATGAQPRSTSSTWTDPVGEVVEPTFRSSLTRLVGDEAREWLAHLPALESEVATRWSLELGPQLQGGLLASVRGVRRADGESAVL